jgi:hypothetical protein
MSESIAAGPPGAKGALYFSLVVIRANVKRWLRRVNRSQARRRSITTALGRDGEREAQ